MRLQLSGSITALASFPCQVPFLFQSEGNSSLLPVCGFGSSPSKEMHSLSCCSETLQGGQDLCLSLLCSCHEASQPVATLLPSANYSSLKTELVYTGVLLNAAGNSWKTTNWNFVLFLLLPDSPSLIFLPRARSAFSPSCSLDFSNDIDFFLEFCKNYKWSP